MPNKSSELKVLEGNFHSFLNYNWETVLTLELIIQHSILVMTNLLIYNPQSAWSAELIQLHIQRESLNIN